MLRRGELEDRFRLRQQLRPDFSSDPSRREIDRETGFINYLPILPGEEMKTQREQ